MKAAAPKALILASAPSNRLMSADNPPKALLRLGGKTLLQRAAETLRAGGVEDVRVVTGHEAWAVEKEAAALHMTCIRNLEYRQGEFSSVCAGLTSLFHADGMDGDGAFFLLPVDAALLWHGSVTAMRRAWQALPAKRRGISCILPVFAGRYGRPPLLGAVFGRELLEHTEGGGLLGFFANLLPPVTRAAMLRGFAPPDDGLPDSPPGGSPDTPQEAEPFPLQSISCTAAGKDVFALHLPDRGLLSGLDLPSELAEAAQFLDRTRQREGFDAREAWEWLRHGHLGVEKTRHCIKVGRGALRLALALQRQSCGVDVELSLCAGLLHDIGRGREHHAELARRWIHTWGKRDCALAVGAHTVLPAPLLARLDISLRDDPRAGDRIGFDTTGYDNASPALALACACVYLADKFFLGDRQVSIAERFDAVRRGFADQPVPLAVIARRERIAQAAAERLTQWMGAPPEEIVATDSGHSLEVLCGKMLDEFSKA